MIIQQTSNKRIAKNTLLLYLRMLLTLSVTLYTSRIVLQALGEIDYGIYNVVGGFVSMFTFLNGGMAAATQRFLSYEIGKGTEGKVRLVFSTAVIIHLMIAVIIFILAETIGIWFLNTQMNFPIERYNAANWVFQFSLITFAVNIVSVPYNAAIIAYEKMKAFAYVSIIEVSLKLLVAYLLLMSSIDKLVIYAALLAIIAIMIRVIYGIYCKRNFGDCQCDWRLNKSFLKEMSAFAGWNLIGTIAFIAKEQGINILLNLFFGAAVNAARGIAYQVLGALNGFVGNFQLAINPQIVKLYSVNEKKEMFNLVFRGSKFSFLIFWLFALPIIIEAPFILHIWLVEVPEYAVIFVRLVLVTSLLETLSGPLITSMHASGKVRNYQIIVGGISLLTLPIGYLLLLFGFPPYSVMWLGIVISILCLIARIVLLNGMIGFPAISFIKDVLFRVLLVSIISLILPIFLYHSFSDTFISFFITIVVCLFISICSSFYIGLVRLERQLVMSKVNAFIKRIGHKVI